MSSRTEFIERQKDQYLLEITSLGGNLVYGAIALAFLALGMHQVFNKLLFGIVLIYAVVVLIKISYFKNRPARYNYNSFIERIDASSFPSVHAIRSVFLAAVLMSYFGNFGISILIGALVLLVAYSRIELKKHDLIDVLGGLVLGILVYLGVNFLMG